MINVIHVLWSAQYGGIQRMVLDLCIEQYKNSEVNSSILFISSKGNYFQEFDNAKIKYTTAGFKGGRSFSFKKLKKIRNQFKKYQIVHFHDFNPIIFLIALTTRKKIIYTEHGNFGFNRRLTFFEKLNHLVKRYALKYFTQAIVCNSSFTKSVLIKRYNIKKEPFVIENGAGSNFFSDPQEAQNYKLQIGDRFVIGTSSRIVEVKRIDRLITAFAIFQKEHKNAVLLLVGDGKLLSEFRKKVVKLSLEDHAIFTGFKRNVHDYQKMMDVCVFPSQNEAFGLVAIETLAIGKPTIVFNDGGGLPEIIKQVNQYDVVDSEKGLVKRLEYYYSLNKKEDLKKETIRKEVAKMYSTQNMEKKYLNVYERLLENVRD